MQNNEQFHATLDELETKNGDMVAVRDVANIVSDIMHSIEGDIAFGDRETRNAVDDVLTHIQLTKRELSSLNPKALAEDHLPMAWSELTAVVAATEEATGSILDVAEDLETLAHSIGSGYEEQILAIATRIYEASNFQDITGQRINKVMNSLKHIEQRLLAISSISEGEINPGDIDRPYIRTEDDDTPLNGPAMPDSANSQDDIDAIMADF